MAGEGKKPEVASAICDVNDYKQEEERAKAAKEAVEQEANKAEALEAMAKMDTNGDGKISRDEVKANLAFDTVRTYTQIRITKLNTFSEIELRVLSSRGIKREPPPNFRVSEKKCVSNNAQQFRI